MTFVDSLDSVLMLYSYSGFPERGLALFEHKRSRAVNLVLPANATSDNAPPIAEVPAEGTLQSPSPVLEAGLQTSGISQIDDYEAQDEIPSTETATRARRNTLSGLSILLTLISIIVAFRYDDLLSDFCSGVF